MATISTILPTSSLVLLATSRQAHHRCKFCSFNSKSRSIKRTSLIVRAAKLPAGVENPKVEPKLEPPFLGFTRTAEIWNSRACMIGLIGVFIVELILNKGILQVIGVDVGKGLDLPL